MEHNKIINHQQSFYPKFFLSNPNSLTFIIDHKSLRINLFKVHLSLILKPMSLNMLIGLVICLKIFVLDFIGKFTLIHQ